MPDEICTACGGTMHFDDFTGTLICSICGSSRPVASAPAPTPAPIAEPESKPESEPAPQVTEPLPPMADAPSTSEANTIPEVRDLIGGGRFEKALESLNKIQRSDKTDSAFLLLSILCGYQVRSTEELLLKVSGSSMAIQKLLSRPDWDLISRGKPGAEDFSFYVKEYFSLCLVQNGANLRELRTKMHGPNKGPRLSPLAKLDEEDSHNAERAAQLRSAQKGSYKTLADRMEALENIPYSTYDSLLGNDDGQTRRYREEISAMAAAGVVRRQRGSETDDQTKTEAVINFPLIRPNITPEEIAERKEELIRLIRQEEQKILE